MKKNKQNPACKKFQAGFFLFIIFWNPWHLTWAQINSPPGRLIPYYEAFIQIDLRYASQTQTTLIPLQSDIYLLETLQNNRRAMGISGRLQTSFRMHYKGLDLTKKFIWTDLMAAELATGWLHKLHPSQDNEIWFAYNFGLGVAGSYRLHSNHEIGLQFFLLKFIIDKVGSNFSGSNVSIRYAYEQLFTEIGVEARDQLFFGWIFKPQFEPRQYFAKIQYSYPNNKTVGLRIEWAQNNYFTNSEELRQWASSQIVAFKLYYGKSF